MKYVYSLSDPSKELPGPAELSLDNMAFVKIGCMAACLCIFDRDGFVLDPCLLVCSLSLTDSMLALWFLASPRIMAKANQFI